ITVSTFQSGANAFVYTIAGSRGAQNEFHIDGIASSGGSTPLGSTSMTTGAARELKVLAVNNSAEYSQPGIYQQISHGGTNDLHGTMQYSHENSVLNARPYFQAARPKSRNHRYGFSVGGPLVVPRIYDGHNRTFFLVSYEGGRTPSTRVALATVPTQAMRAGDFTGFPAILDPLTGTAFAGNLIPAARINPVSRRIQERFYPLPNFGNTAVLAVNNHQFPWDATGRYEHYDVRLDQKLGASNTMYARLGWQQFPVPQMESMLPTIGFLSRLRTFWNPVLSDTHTFTHRLVNEFRIGFVRSQDPVRGPQKGLEVLAYAGIQGIRDVPDAFGMPVFAIPGFNPLTQSRQAILIDQQGQLTDALTWVRGRHSLKVGLDLRRALPYDNAVPIGTYGDFTFSNAFSGHAYADFLLGLPQQSQRAFPIPNDFRRQTQTSFFVQDDFKVGPRLTLTFGLRYEYQTPTRHGRDVLYNFDLATGRVILASESARKLVSPLFNPSVPIAVADGAAFPQDKLWRPDRNNWAPRIGFAFRPAASTDFVVRGGFGIFYDLIGYGMASSFTGGPFTRGADRFVNQITAGQPLFQFPTPFTTEAAGPSTTPPVLNAIIPDLVNPYVSQWNLTVEKEY
ncbi:MAG: TonB-dependent receptor domain-containing protein, partial [Gammaproteobacteria bacterium]